ncbi:hydantoinase/oxoprolinase family protein [Amycolatopsis echigonensis]|uniref:5-oxoprolinase (ATP-hydrolysing)/N-methylhydantoinase A n=1 Tax=Amycolatopsis echigonensis TaxID=2576905 RepID=A0A2N3WN20_9PSEU|nr:MULTISPECIES: hydantoinase/oxoprolinase family protein [Amycolatopsis]MBB2505904.1 hydantoinase/oxoprolinase family protein [Amycolatopsis echigonensis]PKV95261.1 5-oxoprolinase (ATP-hydrolysing)/N-methylhydantoinase A [Amycolatopsis niigatensis]
MKRIGVDVGGTFTDIMYWDEDGDLAVHKVPSTPHDPSQATVDGVRQLAEQVGISVADLGQFLHGTTVATNIVLEHNGADVGLITTEGFRDILHIARKKRPYNYSSYQDLPWQKWQLVRRRNRRVVPERINAAGEVLVPLDEEAVREQVRVLKDNGVAAIAVCFLHAYRNPAHEQAVKRIIEQEYPGVFISLSSEVAPQYREYERFSTTALNAFVGPKVARYIDNLANTTREAGVRGDIRLMTSAGGLITSQHAVDNPVLLLTSGVVAGLLGGCAIGRASGYPSVITLDVGGTSADIGVAPDGKLRMKHLLDTRIGDYHAMVPMAEVDTIGAGGGSVAFVDEGGMFRVGPRSAGATPGPACYNRGGTEPTSTDAMVVLGWLQADSFLSGSMRVEPQLAEKAIEEHIANKLATSVEHAAVGIFQILAHAMTEAISLHSVRKGYDPRDFSLVAEGGAGPLYAWHIAQQLDIPRVIVPHHPGIASAMGLLATDIRVEQPATVWTSLAAPDLDSVRDAFARLEAQVTEQLTGDGLAPEDFVIERSLDCRYIGQGYELRVPAPAGDIDNTWVASASEAFHQVHERTYLQRFDDKPVHLVNVRVTGIGKVGHVPLAEIESGGEDASAAVKGTREAVFWTDGSKPATFPTTVYDRALLKAGNVLTGPAIVEQFDSTTVIGPRQRATIDRVGHIIIETAAGESAAVDAEGGQR